MRLFWGCFGILACGWVCAYAAEPVELRTQDGQVLKGEILSLTTSEVRLKTAFGEVTVPRATLANPEALGAYLKAHVPTTAKTPLGVDGSLDERKILADLARARSPGPLSPQDNAEISRLVGRFGDADRFERAELIEKLRALAPKANSTVGISYSGPADLEVRVSLLRALAVPGNTGAVPQLEEAHALARQAWREKLEEKPDKSSFFTDRGKPIARTKKELKRQADALAGLIPALEGYAAEIGGAGAALFLLKVYTARYAERENLMRNEARDAQALGNLAAQCAREPSLWTPLEKALAAEKFIPCLHDGPLECARMACGLLGALLPAGHPAWNAPQADWAGWWRENREGLLAPRREADPPPVPEKP